MQDDEQDLIFRNYPALLLSLHYCDPADKARIIAMYGLLATVEESLHRASDPVVSRAKLGWWLQELRNVGRTEGVHSLISELQTSGVLSIWPEALITRLFALAMSRINSVGLNNENSLKEHCTSIGLLHLELELALHDSPLPEHALVQHWASINGLMQLIRESFNAKKPSYYWLPLTLCAQFGIERQQVADQPSAELSGRLFSRIAEIADSWLNPIDGSPDHLHNLPMSWLSKNRHWLVLSSLQQRQLRRLRVELAKPGLKVENLKALQRMDLGDGWCAWRLARQLNRTSRD
ncbi:MAG: hypothetical protein SH820_01390 [Xanthomonadales bacterium]|nr:hypothetical protein [Xanthomonadales bacterium]